MPVTADTPLSSQLSAIEDLIAAGTDFQAWTEAANAAEAKESIFVVGVEPPAGQTTFTVEDLKGLRPFVVVNFDNSDGGFEFDSVARGQYTPRGRILLAFEDNVVAEDAKNLKEATYTFLNQVGAVIEEMLDNAETGPYHVIRNVRVRLGPRRATLEEAKTRGDHLVVILAIEVGLND